MNHLSVFWENNCSYFLRTHTNLFDELCFSSLEQFIKYFETRFLQLSENKSSEDRLELINTYLKRAEDYKNKLRRGKDSSNFTLIQNLNKFIEWLNNEKLLLKDDGLEIDHEILKNESYLTIKIRLLIIYYLEKHKIFFIQQVGKTIKMDNNKSTEALFLHAIFGLPPNVDEKKEKGNCQLYKPWCQIHSVNHKEIFNKYNLTQVLEIFKKTTLTSIIEDIETELEKIKEKE